jgi:hypothetical protein
LPTNRRGHAIAPRAAIEFRDRRPWRDEIVKALATRLTAERLNCSPVQLNHKKSRADDACGAR